MKIKTALISVSNKDKLKELLTVLKKYKVRLISSGGTFNKINSLGFNCTNVSNYTKFPEILDGRVKTLHPKIHAGILYKRNKRSHKKILKDLNFESIDLVIANFYPFSEVLKRTRDNKKIIENIDIGGPSLVRSAAKNYKHVTVITEIGQYKSLINELNLHNGQTSLKFRSEMSMRAFGNSVSYDASIYNYFNSLSKISVPEKLIIEAKLIQKLRYGENPHQYGGIYSDDKDFNLVSLQGKPLSYNNYNDIFACLNLVKIMPKNKGIAIVKHANPSGVSIENNNVESYKSALNCDPISAFGGIVACNYKLNIKVAKEIYKNYYEIVIAKGFEWNVLKLFKTKKNLRLIDISNLKFKKKDKIISGINSFLMQQDNNLILNKKNFKVVSKRKLPKDLMKQIMFSLNVCRSVKSNAIVITQNNKTLGIGSGQLSRVDSCQIAIDKMKRFKQYNKKNPIIAVSDAFFPFLDGIEKLIQAGVSIVIQPSGSIRDKDIIKFANKMNVVLVFSKTRHFSH